MAKIIRQSQCIIEISNIPRKKKKSESSEFSKIIIPNTVKDVHFLWQAVLVKYVPHFAAGAPISRRLRRLSAAGAPVFRRLMRRMRLGSRRLMRISAAGAPICGRCACF